MPFFLPILRLVRIDSSLLGAMTIFLALLRRTDDFKLSLVRALPILFICMCTFISNDLFDIEKDRLNHPDRPLPSNQIRPMIASILYYVVLGFALFATRRYVEEPISFWYYGLFVISVSYNIAVEHLTSIKPIYVAATAVAPILIATYWFPDSRLYILFISAFLLVFGREVCMDIIDRKGDNPSKLTSFDPQKLALFAFASQTFGAVLLITVLSSTLDLIILITLAVFLICSTLLWFRYSLRKASVVSMKLQLIVGLLLLI